MYNSDLIKSIYEKGRYKDLLDLLMDESEYNISIEEYKASGSNEADIPREQRYLRSSAINHLRFIEKYGLINEIKVDEIGHVHGPNYEEFEEWFSCGCPGFITIELERYLLNNPL